MRRWETRIKELFRAVHSADTGLKRIMFGGFGCIVLAAAYFHMREQNIFLFTVASLELLALGILLIWVAFDAAMQQERKREEDKKAKEDRKAKKRTEENKKETVPESIVPQRPVHVADKKLQKLAMQCGRGDNDAMYQLSKYLKGEKAPNMWLLRAAVYGNEKAQHQVLQKMNADRSFLKKLLFPCENFIPGKRDHWWTGKYPGTVLNAAGLLYFKPMEEYLIDGFDENRCMLVGSYAGYEPCDEDGFGYEEYYDWYYVNEFFEPIPDGIVLKGASMRELNRDEKYSQMRDQAVAWSLDAHVKDRNLWTGYMKSD